MKISKSYVFFKFLVVYLVSAVSGSLMSCIFNESLSVGASGAIFGLLGALLYFVMHPKKQKSNENVTLKFEA